LLQNPYDTTHPTLGMLLHYLGKVKFKFKAYNSADVEANANRVHFFIASNFVIHPQILIFSVFKLAILSPCCIYRPSMIINKIFRVAVLLHLLLPSICAHTEENVATVND